MGIVLCFTVGRKRPRSCPSTSLYAGRTALRRRQAIISLFGLISPETGHERVAPVTDKPDSQDPSVP